METAAAGQPQLRRLPFVDQVERVSAALVALVANNPNIAESYPYEPVIFSDVWPALTVEHTGFARTSGASNDLHLPNVLSFTVRAYYPIADPGGGVDGYQVAQDRTLRAMDAFLMAAAKNPRLTPDVMVLAIESTQGRALPVRDKQILRCYEAQISVRIH